MKQVKSIKPVVGRQTYMRMIVSEYPVRGGNRFWFGNCECTNMNAENLQEWLRQNPNVDELRVEFDEVTREIIDERVESGWFGR